MNESSTMKSEGVPRQVLSTRHLIFFVIATAAPLGFSVGTIPIGLGRGGIGLSGAFLVTAALLAVFAVGYVVMAAHIRSSGGLYAFVGAGLGKPMGAAASYVAATAYGLAATGSIGALAVFAGAAATDVLGIDLPWPVWALTGVALMGIMGALKVDLSAKLLGLVIFLEIAILVLISTVILVKGGAEGVSLTAFEPNHVFGGNIGVTFAVTIAAFAGFEATVIYSREAKDRQRTVRRATLGAIAILGLLYAFVSWAVSVAYGNAKAVDAANADPVTLFFAATNQYVGPWAVHLLEVLVVASWFASVVAFHNAVARYLASMGRGRLLPTAIGVLHPRFGSPLRASLTHTLFTLVVVLIIIALGADPFLDLFILGSTPAGIAIPALELLASIAIVAFFLRSRRGHPFWQVILAPSVAALGLAALLVAIITQLPLFTGRSGPINVVLVAIVAAALLGGLLRGLVLQRRQRKESTEGVQQTANT
ncbi:amino acid permease (plasmid) [Arthrobacter sp. StoSoilB3]|nr:amino acid permease [Arthrobacter sp. StoSoilB3]